MKKTYYVLSMLILLIINSTFAEFNTSGIDYDNMKYNEILYITIKNDTAYVKDIINGTNTPHYVKSAGIVLYEDIYGCNYSYLLYTNSSSSIVFYYNFSVDKLNNTINITIPQLEDYVGSLGRIRMRIPPNDIKIAIFAENKLAETNGKYILEYNKTSKKVVSLIYLDDISSICNIYHPKFFNSSEFYGYMVKNTTSIGENNTSYIIKNSKGTFTFDKKYNVFVSNNTAYLKEPYFYVKLYDSTPDDVIVLEERRNSPSLLGVIGIILGFGLIVLAIYLDRRGRT